MGYGIYTGYYAYICRGDGGTKCVGAASILFSFIFSVLSSIDFGGCCREGLYYLL